MADRKKASDFPKEVLALFDGYVHGFIDRRAFVEGAAKVVGAVPRRWRCSTWRESQWASPPARSSAQRLARHWMRA